MTAFFKNHFRNCDDISSQEMLSKTTLNLFLIARLRKYCKFISKTWIDIKK